MPLLEAEAAESLPLAVPESAPSVGAVPDSVAELEADESPCGCLCDPDGEVVESDDDDEDGSVAADASAVSE